MKKIITLGIFLIAILSSCKKNIDISYKIEEYSHIYLINSNQRIERIEIAYEIKDIIDIFNIYTCYQNNIPIGYFSPAHPNLKLLDYEINNRIIYSNVNEFIKQSDVNSLYNTLKLSLNEIGYQDIYIFFNNNRII